MKTQKTLLIIVLFIVAITGIRLTWLALNRTVDHPQASGGILDLRGWKLPPSHTIPLEGEWDFYPDALIVPSSEPGNELAGIRGKTSIPVPGSWRKYFPEEHRSSYYAGTYRLQILMDKEAAESAYLLRTGDIKRASAVYINGKWVAGQGRLSENGDEFTPKYMPYTIPVPQGSTKVDIVIQAASHVGEGGIVQSIRFGTTSAVNHRIGLSMALQGLLCVVLLVHALYGVMLYFLGAPRKGLLYFAAVIFCAILSVIGADDKLLYHWLPGMSFEIGVRVVIASYIGVVSFIPPLVKNMFPNVGQSRLLRIFAWFSAGYAALVLFLPTRITLPLERFMLTAVLLSAVLITAFLLRKAVRNQEDVIFLLLACSSLGTNILWTIAQSRLGLQHMHYPFDLIFTVLAFAAFWFRRYFRTAQQTERLADQLQRANRQKDDFLVNTSHELRNPLHGIMNLTQSVLDDQEHPAGEAQRQKLEIQLSVARRMSRLLDDLLDAARLKENSLRLNFVAVRLQTVVPGLLQMLDYLLDGKPVQMRIGIADDFPSVRADENRLIQVLYNLLHNAIKFTDRGEIALEADTMGDMACIRVKDTGIGMDEETCQRIFKPYEQGPSIMERAAGGFGLGLSICRQLVALHGGTLEVSSSLGRGSVFTFTLPLAVGGKTAGSLGPEPAGLTGPQAGPAEAGAREAEHRDRPVSQPIVNSGKPRILAVDDDPVNLKILADLLGPAEYEITTATNAEEALGFLSQGTFELVVADVMMPGVSGYELTRAIRGRYTVSELPVLLLTARNRPEDIFTGFESGANDYVTKPVDAWELRSRVRALTALKVSIEERLRLEAAWLQAQIQPHFLHNTINSIAALSTVDTGKMQRLLEEFSNYLRTSFDFHNADRVVPVASELDLVRSYLFIEKERFGDRLNIRWTLDVEPNFTLPPLSIQTLVENALHHGILRRSQGGTVEIRIVRSDQGYEVAVNDDGVGISEELQRLILEPSFRPGQGVGLRNTDRRLKQYYGKGLKIRSAPDRGTSVSFHIPV
ncbi:ATP-binding protein [Paenibacillus timonensis]|uniref:histidine kinase n=1 Tax=Paenibacillus timonensis TaxID=225915 RepID=A0ABW3S929_9BACL|nr:ATP-binding protein [Paenibacillus timonensis]MCH1639411.1 ATP-binding protein [Paenibacillus timonensis]